MTRTATLVARLRTTATVPTVAPATVIALPPSDDDPAADVMRVVVNGATTTRQYDPEMEQP